MLVVTSSRTYLSWHRWLLCMGSKNVHVLCMHELRVAGRRGWGLVDWDVKTFDVILQIHVLLFQETLYPSLCTSPLDLSGVLTMLVSEERRRNDSTRPWLRTGRLHDGTKTSRPIAFVELRPPASRRPSTTTQQ
jgi:hypothetical protein